MFFGGTSRLCIPECPDGSRDCLPSSSSIYSSSTSTSSTPLSESSSAGSPTLTSDSVSSISPAPPSSTSLGEAAILVLSTTSFHKSRLPSASSISPALASADTPIVEVASFTTETVSLDGATVTSTALLSLPTGFGDCYIYKLVRLNNWSSARTRHRHTTKLTCFAPRRTLNQLAVQASTLR